MVTGRPSVLTERIAQDILAAIPQVMVLPQIAAMARVPRTTLQSWLVRGREDEEKGIESDYALFSADYDNTRSQVVRDMLNKIIQDPDHTKAYSWILEKCFREDFGKESEEMRELRLLFSQFMQTQLMGDSNGKQVKSVGTVASSAEDAGQS